jgi:hypothetical protein
MPRATRQTSHLTGRWFAVLGGLGLGLILVGIAAMAYALAG